MQDLDDYCRWLETVVEDAEQFGGALRDPDYLAISDQEFGILAGVGETLSLEVAPGRVEFPNGSYVAFDMHVQQTNFFDRRPTEIVEVRYGYHVQSEGQFLWRYDCHDDHHGFGNPYHVHIGTAFEGQRAGVFPSDEVALDDVLRIMLDTNVIW